MKRLFHYITLLSFLLCIKGFAASPVQLNKLQILNINHNSRLVLSLNKSFRYGLDYNKHTRELLIFLKNTYLNMAIRNVHLGNSLVRGIRSRQLSSGTLKLLFMLKQPATYKTFIQKPRGRFNYRLIVDLVSRQPKKTVLYHAIKNKTKYVGKIKKPITKKHITKTKPFHIRRAVVVIDPGHGGKDPGATGPDGVHEKDVVLAIGRDLNIDLKKVSNIDSEMTRSGNYFVTLRGRLQFAREKQADLFIAIHADAYKNRYAHGASVFALSRHGASSEAARWLAQRENYSELGGVNLEDKSYMLRSVLIDLSQTVTIRESLRFGQAIMHSLAKHVQLHRGRVEQAPFVVLKSPDIPSLLVETGFISNRREEMRLRSPLYQKKIAQSLANGIVNYLKNYPPRGTQLYIDKFGITHTVKKGETLLQLARRYGVTMSAIRKANHLRKDTLFVGQMVHVPRKQQL